MPRKPKHEPNIFERRPGDWYFRFRETLADGTKKDRWIFAGTKTAALELKAKFKDQARRQKLGLDPLPPSPAELERKRQEEKRLAMTVSELIERYRSTFEAKRACTENQRYASVWIKDIGHQVARHVVPGDIEAWRQRQFAAGMKTNTVKNYCSFLRRIYNLGIRDTKETLLDFNPLAKGRLEKLDPVDPRDRVLEPAEEALLLAELTPVDRAAFVIALYGGLRQGEILGLERADIDFTRRRVRLRTTKAKKTQWAFLNDAALEAITFMMSQHDHDLIFINARGTGRMSGAQLTNRIQTAAKRLGFSDVLFHTARHTYITRLSSAGNDIGVVKSAARHSSVTITESYMHTAGKETQAAVDKLSATYMGAGGLFPAAPSSRGHLRALS